MSGSHRKDVYKGVILPPVPVANYVQVLAAASLARSVKPFVPIAFQSGAETWFEGSGAFLVNDAQAWNRIWDRHIQNEAFGNQRGVRNLNPAPELDFNNALVVSLFAGPTPGIVGYRVAGGYRFGKKATIRLVPVVDASRRAMIAVPRPFAFLVLPRSDATVSVQLLGNDVWTTVATVQPSL